MSAERLERLGGLALTEAARDRAAVVAAFLATVAGTSARTVQDGTAVDDAVVNRLRSLQSGVKGTTLERMRQHLARAAGSRASA